MNLNWENYIWDEDHPVSSEQVNLLEEKLKVKSPRDYKTFAMEHHGMSPESGIIPIGDSETFITTLLHFEIDDLDSENYTYSIYGSHETLKVYLNHLIVPFAIASGASNFCFDYRVSKDKPTIIFLDSDYGGDKEAIHPVAKNFTEFLTMLEE